MKKILAIALSALLATPHSFAGNTTVATKATASLSATCTISAQNVNFGPLNVQTSSAGVTASSSMSLFCSKAASYTISLGGSTANYTIDGNLMGVQYACPNNCSGIPYNYHYYYIYSGPTDYTQNPNNYVSRVLYYNGTYVNNLSAIKGAASGDLIQYKITIPGDDTKIWNRGNYSYTDKGTGTTQTIPVKATLTTNAYPTPDSYYDIVTAIVTF